MRKLLAVSVLAGLVLLAGVPNVRGQSSGTSRESIEVQMTAKKYSFSPSIVEVTAGTRIVFKITALDREHGFEIADVKDSCVKIKEGTTVTVEYAAEKPGTVEFRCCVFCGLGHRGMKGKIVIRPVAPS